METGMDTGMDTGMATGTGVHVLVVEDDGDTRHVLRLILEDAGYTISQASEGVAALDLLRRSPVPLVVLLDWWLPELDGIAVLRAMAGDVAGASRHTYILMTAAPEPRATTLARVPPSMTPSLLCKPFGLETLLEMVAAAARRLHAPGVTASATGGSPTRGARGAEGGRGQA